MPHERTLNRPRPAREAAEPPSSVESPRATSGDPVVEEWLPPVERDAEDAHVVHARREVAVGAVLGVASIGLALFAAIFPDLMAGANYAPTFSLLGLHLLWMLVALLAAGQGVKMWRMARWAAAHADEDITERGAQLTLWLGAAFVPVLAVIAALVALFV